ncbi:hypothetical protein VitviT2T_016001 [Vitis vinifera]|uniref:RING-type E3 ubiquitin transferase n=2 Tax=Vitis vinifera TaxID=29760 RepID=A0ABY9CPC9_VITVI|nr:hypothetical protein VitviT2T_016001 [Vitis vinifera]
MKGIPPNAWLILFALSREEALGGMNNNEWNIQVLIGDGHIKKSLDAIGFVLAVENVSPRTKFDPVPVSIPGVLITDVSKSMDLIDYYNTSTSRDWTGRVKSFKATGSIGDGLMPILHKSAPQFKMANGSLEDRIFRRGDSPPLSWQPRFRIAAEISTGLLFPHQTKSEPQVHHDLKLASILLDPNYVSKISDVGLVRLVPLSVADSVTQYQMTSTAGNFCYIDPEYQQAGMLGIKSDVYSLGIMLLQIITAKPPMELIHLVERAIGKELRRKDGPDLGKAVLPELNRMGEFSEEHLDPQARPVLHGRLMHVTQGPRVIFPFLQSSLILKKIFPNFIL